MGLTGGEFEGGGFAIAGNGVALLAFLLSIIPETVSTIERSTVPGIVLSTLR